MATVPRVLVVAAVAFRSSLTGWRALALAALAAVPTLIVLAIAASGTPADRVEGIAQELFLTLTLRVVVVLSLLVVFVGLFRSEIELDTLTYLTTRSIPRAGIAVGKYLGGLAAALLLLVPAGLLPLGVAQAAGAAAPPSVVPVALIEILALAGAAYGAFFLLLGLLSRSALILGLIYGFLWEELVLLLPGQFPKLTVLYYLLSVGSTQVTTGALAGFRTSVTLPAALAVPLAVAAAWMVVTGLLVRYVETAPQRVSA